MMSKYEMDNTVTVLAHDANNSINTLYLCEIEAFGEDLSRSQLYKPYTNNEMPTIG